MFASDLFSRNHEAVHTIIMASMAEAFKSPKMHVHQVRLRANNTTPSASPIHGRWSFITIGVTTTEIING